MPGHQGTTPVPPDWIDSKWVWCGFRARSRGAIHQAAWRATPGDIQNQSLAVLLIYCRPSWPLHRLLMVWDQAVLCSSFRSQGAISRIACKLARG